MKIETLHKMNGFLNMVISPKMLMLLMILTQIMLWFGDVINYIDVMFVISSFIIFLWVFVVVMSLVYGDLIKAAVADQKVKEERWWMSKLRMDGKIEFTEEGESVYDDKTIG